MSSVLSPASCSEDSPVSKADPQVVKLACRLLDRIERAPGELGIPHEAIDPVLQQELGITSGCSATREEIIAALSPCNGTDITARQDRVRSLLFQLRPPHRCVQ